MSKVVARTWRGSDVGLSRRDRQPCRYEAYVPDPLIGREFTFEGTVAADVSDAEAAIARLNATARSLVDTEALARILLRAESVASSKIEGLVVGPRRLLKAEVLRHVGDDPTDVTAAEVLGNIDAMTYAISTVTGGADITVDILLEVHRRLLAGTGLDSHAGRVRGEQNWIGGSSHNPCSAAFVPPPPEYVPELLDDLADFCNQDTLPPVAQAAIAHAQFETIHPFVDGNGRTGRALIQLVLRRRGLAPRVLPPISLVLATRSRSYISGLSATRYKGSPTTHQARDGINAWVGEFASATTRAVIDADAFEQNAAAIEARWRSRIGRVRRGSSVDLLLSALLGAPVITATSAARVIGRSFIQTNSAIARLTAVGVLKQTTVGRRNRAFEAGDIIEAFATLERQLASPDGDTSISPPTRPTPQRH